MSLFFRSALIFCLALVFVAPVWAETTFVDPRRGVGKQRDAAKDAAKIVADGKEFAERVLRLLADDSGVVRDRVVADVIRGWQDDGLAALGSGLVSKESLIAEGVAEIYGARKFGAPALAAALGKQRHEDARVVTLWALGRCANEKSWKPVASVFKREKKAFRVQGEALVTLFAIDAERARPLAEDAVNGKSIPLRIVALELLAGVDAEATVNAATAAFASPPKDKSGVWLPRLRLAALEILQGIERTAVPGTVWMACVDALLLGVDEVVGREHRDTYATLREIVGPSSNDLPNDALQWRNWWAAQKKEWTPTTGDVAVPTGRTGVRYHEAEIASDRVTFLVDLSGGMDRPMEQGGSGKSRVELAKDELHRVLGELHDSVYVQLVYFGSYYHSFDKQPALIKKARGKLQKFNRSQQISKKIGHSRGNIYDSLAFALQQPHTDTVFLLSEGAPTEGKYQDNLRFMTHLQRLNRYYRVRIHTLLIGKTGGRARQLIRDIATTSGGDHHDLADRQ
ncbi:MAG: hypothetical protein AAF581_03320 [Planctomycetota bacterium]